MALTDILEIIKNINGGCIIPEIDDKDSCFCLGTDDVRLYIGRGKKYYYFAEYKQKDEENNIPEIEQIILYNDKNNGIAKPEPQYAYLILIYIVDKIDKNLNKKVIELEENEYFYKKYVFYYTQEEFDSFKMWSNGQKDISITSLINNSAVTNNMDSDYARFILRLLIKIPFIKFDFQKSELKDFKNNLDGNILRMRTSTAILELNDYITTLFESTDYNINEAVERFYKEKVGE